MSRVTARAGVYHFGRIRRAEWLPVGGPGEPVEQEHRLLASEDSGDDSEDGSEYEAMAGDCGVSADLRAVREGRVPSEGSSRSEEGDPVDFSTDSEGDLLR